MRACVRVWVCTCLSQATAVTYSLCSWGPWAARAVLISSAGAQLRPAWHSEHIYVHVELTFSIFNQVSTARGSDSGSRETKLRTIYGCMCDFTPCLSVRWVVFGARLNIAAHSGLSGRPCGRGLNQTRQTGEIEILRAAAWAPPLCLRPVLTTSPPPPLPGRCSPFGAFRRFGEVG